MLDFTGERVVPGLVDPNLFNEHLARYRFATRLAGGMRVLDAGCGSGYGTAELANAAAVVAIDISASAVTHARSAFARPGVHFLQGACESLPLADESFDLLLAFEVIEHLERWQDMLSEARRVLRPSGVLLVSTPNKAWYTESRGSSGPNPYHVHEFEYREFETALLATFPHVHIWTQNHAESVAFVPDSSSRGVLDAPPDTAPEQAHFFLAACSQSPIVDTSAFAWLPSTGNILRERQRHISLLESEIEQKDAWLADARDSQAKLQKTHDEVLVELHERNAWAARLNAELDKERALFTQLQRELTATHAQYQEQVSRLEAEAAARLEWVRDLETQLALGNAEIERQRGEHLEQKATITERTLWAQSVEKELTQAQEELKKTEAERRRLTTELQGLENAKWVRAGRKLQLIPDKE
jgi:ubiquinone/menaquinone biosynthesis C-methylase UbiE